MKNVENVYPLTPLQQGMLFRSLHSDGGSEYFRQLTFEIVGALNAPALQRAWQAVVNRHAALRTSFLWDELPEPVQVVHRQIDLPWRELDWQSLAPEDQLTEIEVLLREHRERGFDLKIAPLLDCVLIHTLPERVRFVMNFHHIILDGWSVPVLFREVAEIYDAIVAGRELNLPPAPVFRDYISWRRKQSTTKAEEFWRKYLAGVAAPTPLGLADRTGSTSSEHLEIRDSLGQDLTAALRECARRQRVTLNTVVQGAWAILLSRYSGQNDVVFGSVVSGRPHDLPGVEQMVGVFINIPPVRVQTDSEPTVASLLRRIQHEDAEAREFEHVSLPDIRRWSGVRGGRELFDSIIIFENFPSASALQAGSGTFRTQNSQSFERTHYPLTLMASPGVDLELLVICAPGLFETDVPERLLGHLKTLLGAIAANPDSSVSELPMLTQAEQRQILDEFNQTEVPLPPEKCFFELFEQQAQRTPNAIAAVHQAQQLTYEELNRSSNRLAHALCRQGAGKGSLIAVCLDRSLNLLVALLGIAKSGAAYVPLDPEYPLERIRYMLKDSGATLLVSESSLGASKLVEDCSVFLLDKAGPAIASEPDITLERKSDGEDLAYVIYTSGSTGNPKGVMIRHRGLVNLLLSMQKSPGLTASDTILAITTICFDIAGLELFLPLITGARVVIASRETARDPERLAESIQREGVTVLQATPVTWRMLIEAGWTGHPQLKLLCGGEALPRDLANELLTRGASLWNVYGPTETTIWSTVARIEPGDDSISIGRPIDNTKIFILDSQLRPVPIGHTGRLYIGGEGLARGYWRRPELTAKAFSLNPFRSDARQDGESDRMYFTGDMARFRADGAVECLGRVDDQIKIRGYRIELGEIEAALRNHSQVRDAVVVARPTLNGSPVLAAYLVPESRNAPPQFTDLYQHTRQFLPDYMVPASFTFLESIPQTPNGKVDRKALPDPSAAQIKLPANTSADPAAVTETQQRLIAIWKALLGVPEVGVQDDFFELGGHSLLAVKLVTKIEQEFGIRLPIATLFEAHVLADVASVIDAGASKDNFSSLIPLKPAGTAPPFFCVSSLGANLLSYRELAKFLDPDQPLYGLQPVGLDGQSKIHGSVEEMAAHYILEMRRVQPEGPYYVGGVCLGGIIAYEIAQQLKEQGHKTGAVILIDSYYAPEAKHMPTRVFKVTPLTLFDYYLGEFRLLQGFGPRFAYLQMRLIRALTRTLRWTGGALKWKGTEAENADVIFQRIQGIHSMAERAYRPRPYEGKLTLLWCAEFPGRGYQDKRMGWAEVADGGLEVHVIPGNHFSMLSPAHAPALVETLTTCLRRARADSTPSKEATHA